MAVTSKTDIIHELLPVQGELDIEHGGGYLKIFLSEDTVE
jgi:hypothetical protein